MSLTAVSLAGSGNFPATNELVVDMYKKRLNAAAPMTPFTKITSRLSKMGAQNFRVDLTEEHEIPTRVTIAQTESSAGTTVYVTDYGTTLVQDTLLYNPRTNDLRIVDTTPTTNTVTVTISQGGTTSAVWQQGDEIEVLLPALDENDEDTLRDVSIANSNIYNYEQLVKLQFSISRINDKMVTHFGGPGSFRMQQQRQKWYEFNVKGEKTCLFGGRSTGGTAPATKRMMGGITQTLYNGTLFKDFGGTITESGFDNWVGDYYDQNPDATNIAYMAAPNVLRRLNYWAKDKLQVSPMSSAYGMNLQRYIGGPLAVDLIPMPLFTSQELRGWGYLLDFSRIFMKYLDTPKLHKDAKDIGVSEKIIDTYREVRSMLMANESRHAMHVGALV